MSSPKPVPLATLLSASSMLSARMAHISPGEWQGAVGEKLAQRTHPERIADGVLTVRVPSSTWAQELSCYRKSCSRGCRPRGTASNGCAFTCLRVLPRQIYPSRQCDGRLCQRRFSDRSPRLQIRSSGASLPRQQLTAWGGNPANQAAASQLGFTSAVLPLRGSRSSCSPRPRGRR